MKNITKFVGLDVHRDTIAVGVADREGGRGRYWGTIPHRPEAVRRLMEQLGPKERLLVCYEAGPTGYGLQRLLASLGIECIVVAPALTPTPPGDRVKTHRGDAVRLAEQVQANDRAPLFYLRTRRHGGFDGRIPAAGGVAMARCLRPNAHVLRERCATGRQVIVSAPFYTAEALEWITPDPNGNLELWTRLNPYDWAARLNDPEALVDYIERIGADRVTLFVHRALHAKFYIVDWSWAWVGSANLTLHAFEQNIELLCELEPNEMESLQRQVEILRSSMTRITLNNLRDLYACMSDVVREYQERGETGIPEEMQEQMLVAVRLCDEILVRSETLPAHLVPSIERFIKFLERHSHKPSAKEIIERYRGKSSLQGHVRQSYFGCCLFLMHHDYQKHRHALADLVDQQVPNIGRDVVRDWQSFLDKYARVEYDGYSLSILRNILPESLGGYTTTGGGASPTWKRVMAWVARFLDNEGD